MGAAKDQSKTELKQQVDYIFTLTNNRNKKFLSIGWILLLINIVITAYAFSSLQDKSDWYLYLLPTAWISWTLLYILRKNWGNKTAKVLSGGLFAAALVWAFLDAYTAMVLHTFLAILGWKLPEKAEISFSPKGMTIPAMPVKLVPWNELKWAIWKDGLLTIQRIDNRILQEETKEDLSKYEAEQFQSWVLTQIEKTAKIADATRDAQEDVTRGSQEMNSQKNDYNAAN